MHEEKSRVLRPERNIDGGCFEFPAKRYKRGGSLGGRAGCISRAPQRRASSLIQMYIYRSLNVVLLLTAPSDCTATSPCTSERPASPSPADFLLTAVGARRRADGCPVASCRCTFPFSCTCPCSLCARAFALSACSCSAIASLRSRSPCSRQVPPARHAIVTQDHSHPATATRAYTHSHPATAKCAYNHSHPMSASFSLL